MMVIFVATFVLTVIGIICKRASWDFEKPNKPISLVFLEMVDLAFPDLEKKKDDGYDVFGCICFYAIDSNNRACHLFHLLHHILECVCCGGGSWRCVRGEFRLLP